METRKEESQYLVLTASPGYITASRDGSNIAVISIHNFDVRLKSGRTGLDILDSGRVKTGGLWEQIIINGTPVTFDNYESLVAALKNDASGSGGGPIVEEDPIFSDWIDRKDSSKNVVSVNIQSTNDSGDGSKEFPFKQVPATQQSDTVYQLSPGSYQSITINNVQRVAITGIDSAYNQSRSQVQNVTIEDTAGHVGIVGLNISGSIIDESNVGNIYIDNCEIAGSLDSNGSSYMLLKDCVMRGFSLTNSSYSLPAEIISCVDERSNGSVKTPWVINPGDGRIVLINKCRGMVLNILSGNVIILDTYLGLDVAGVSIYLSGNANVSIVGGSMRQADGVSGLVEKDQAYLGVFNNLSLDELDLQGNVVIDAKYFTPVEQGDKLVIQGATLEEMYAYYVKYSRKLHPVASTERVQGIYIEQLSISASVVYMIYRFAVVDGDTVTRYRVSLSGSSINVQTLFCDIIGVYDLSRLREESVLYDNSTAIQIPILDSGVNLVVSPNGANARYSLAANDGPITLERAYRTSRYNGAPEGTVVPETILESQVLDALAVAVDDTVYRDFNDTSTVRIWVNGERYDIYEMVIGNGKMTYCMRKFTFENQVYSTYSGEFKVDENDDE